MGHPAQLDRGVRCSTHQATKPPSHQATKPPGCGVSCVPGRFSRILTGADAVVGEPEASRCEMCRMPQFGSVFGHAAGIQTLRNHAAASAPSVERADLEHSICLLAKLSCPMRQAEPTLAGTPAHVRPGT